MKNLFTNGIVLVCLFMVQLFVSGCAGTSAPSRFYTLHALSDTGATENAPAIEYALSAALGPVEIPDYLDRQQIVVRNGPNELTLAPFDRWAGSLRDDITRVVSENLTFLLSDYGLSVSPWQWRPASDYRIALHIRSFDIMQDGNVVVKAQWDIFGKDGATMLLTEEASLKEPIDGDTYAARAGSMSKALERLSRRIAEGLASLLRKG